MDSSSRLDLFQIFEGVIQWRKTLDLFREDAAIPWTEYHLSSVYSYILKLSNINSEFELLRKLLAFGDVKSDSHLSTAIVASFLEELRDFFTVPNLRRLCGDDNPKALKKNELLAAFIDFLLKLLHRQTDLVCSFEDRIEDLKKELRFVVTILGDTLLLDDELEQVNNLLVEFEAVANEAGSFVYSITFSMDREFVSARMDDALASLSNYFNCLRDNITNFIFQLRCFSRAVRIPKTGTLDSLFIVDSLLNDLENLMNWEDETIVDVKGQIKILHQGLMHSQNLLKDMKVPPLYEIGELKKPVMRIRDVAYEAEYLINSFFVGDAPLWYPTIRLPTVVQKTEQIADELQEFKKIYDIGALEVVKNFSAPLSTQAKKNSEVDDVLMVGFENEGTHNILHQLVGGTEHLQIITIFGRPGLGKTTLAKKLYNKVNSHFDERAWCVVSQTYQKKNLLIDVLISLGSKLDKVQIPDMEEEVLGEHLHKCLWKRRYLIVMDDVWDSIVWDDVRRYFPDDVNGSRILFTSRNKDVSPPDSIIYELPTLSHDQCWELLKMKVFHNKHCPPQLQRIGKQIAENCHGLPLAVVVIAGILSTMDKKESTWTKVRRSLASYIFSDQNNSVVEILELSYKHLPDHLKRCFLYFGVFSGVKEVRVEKLTRLWIAEGFVCKEENNNPESVAEEYLMGLVDKSLVIVAKRRSDGRAKNCVMHDLLRDLCLRIAEEENFLKLMDNNCSIHTKHRRLCFRKKLEDHMPPYEFSLPFYLGVRSLFVSYLYPSFNFPNKKLLRVLDSPGNELILCEGIKHLIHLRYLSVVYMPASIDSLVNLEFLIVSRTQEENETEDEKHSVSSITQKLVKLRYLSVPKAFLGEYCSSSRPNNLEFLSTIRIDKVEDEEMLKCSPLLRKLKCKCEPFVDKQGIRRYPDLRFLTQLESLKLTTSTADVREWNTSINFPSNVKKLTLSYLALPWEKISVVGRLAKLEVLKLENNAFVGVVWNTRDGDFQQLRFLQLYHLAVTQWNVASSKHFPRLQRLVLNDCHKLQEIPCEIGEITTLQLIQIERCSKTLEASAIKIQQQQLDETGNDELKVIVGTGNSSYY